MSTEDGTGTNLNVLTSDEFQQIQADKLEREFNQDQQAEKAGNLITVFVRSYRQHKDTMPLDQWLETELGNYPDVWQSEAEIAQTAKEIIETVTRGNEARVSLYEHTDQGKSQASWVASRVEEGAQAAGSVSVGAYAGQIESAIERANADMASTVFRNDGNISQAYNLDGFIAEQHHVDTFNLEAAAQGSTYRAKALVPDGSTYGKNSMDIGIYDADGKLVRRYQVKYGQDADATQDLWEKGDYRGQQKLVPADQVEHIDGATDHIEHDGVKSRPLTKAEAKAMQEEAQLKGEAKVYKWNDVSRSEIAKNIGKQALISAGMVAAFHGARIFGRRIWNNLTGKQNPSKNEDLREFFESSVKGATQTGIQVAVSGAVVVAAKSGWLGKLLERTPAKQLTGIVCVAMENAKILVKLAKGDLSSMEAMDSMGKVSTSMGVSLFSAGVGMEQGAILGAALGGPPGAMLVGLIGGVLGGMAGSKVGEAIYEGGKAIVKTAVAVVQSTASAVYSGVRSIVSACFSWL